MTLRRFKREKSPEGSSIWSFFTDRWVPHLSDRHQGSQGQTLSSKLQSKPYKLNQYNPCTTRSCVNAKPVFWYNQSQEISMWFCFQGWSGAKAVSNHLIRSWSPSWEWIESQFHKTDQVPKPWATIWSRLDLYQLLTSNQLLIKSNPNEHQYKSNWCLIGGSFCKRILFGRDTEL
jgi:hypothetical protein